VCQGKKAGMDANFMLCTYFSSIYCIYIAKSKGKSLISRKRLP